MRMELRVRQSQGGRGIMNKIEQEMKEEKLWDWFKKKHGDRLWEVAKKTKKLKNKNMPWYKKMLYCNDNYQWIYDRTEKLLNLEFDIALNVKNEVKG